MSKNRVVIIADLHCGHRAGLTPPGFQHKNEAGHVWQKFARVQEECWKLYAAEVKSLRPVHLLIVNGDCIDGRGEKSGGVELVTGDRNEQCDMAVECIKRWNAKHICITRGTSYHVGTEEDWEDKIARHQDVGAKIGDHEWVDVNGFVFDVKHHIGGSQVPHGRGTPLARDVLWNQLWADAGEQPRGDLIVRCLSSDTEILTGRGWSPMGSVSVGDQAVTMNMESGILEWGRVRAVTSGNNDTEMVHVFPKGVDALVTKDHDMIYRHREEGAVGRWQKKHAEDVLRMTAFQIPVSGMLERPGVSLSDGMIKLLAWAIAEGNMDAGNRSKGYPEKNNLRIYQGISKAHEVEAVLNEAGVTYTKHTRKLKGRAISQPNGKTYYSKENGVMFYIRQPFSKKIIKILNGEKDIPDWLMQMNNRQFEMFLREYVRGDGHAEPNAKRFQGKVFTSNKSLADRMHILLVTNGYKSQVSTKYTYWGKVGYVIMFVKKQEIRINQSRYTSMSVVPYTGETWCVSVDNGTIVTRRNGRVLIVGNSHAHYWEGQYRMMGGRRVEAVITPALQAMGTRFGARRCSGSVHWGVLAFDIDDKGRIVCRHEGIHSVVATRAKAYSV